MVILTPLLFTLAEGQTQSFLKGRSQTCSGAARSWGVSCGCYLSKEQKHLNNLGRDLLPTAVTSSQFLSLNSMKKTLFHKNNNSSLGITMGIPQMAASICTPQRAVSVIIQTHVASIVNSSSQTPKWAIRYPGGWIADFPACFLPQSQRSLIFAAKTTTGQDHLQGQQEKTGERGRDQMNFFTALQLALSVLWKCS